MADWSICGVDLNDDECPVDGHVPFVRPHKYVYANMYGATGRLKQKVYTDALEVRLHLLLSRETMDAIAAVYDAHAADGELRGLFVNPEPPYDEGVLMKITEFSAEWTEDTRGLPWFDCNIVMVE